MVEYWPRTKIVKSKGNAFDWRASGSSVMSAKDRRAEKVSKAASKFINDKRKQGVDVSHVSGLNSLNERDLSRFVA